MHKNWLIFFAAVGCWSLDLNSAARQKGGSGLPPKENLKDQISYGQAECAGHHKDCWREVRQDLRDQMRKRSGLAGERPDLREKKN